jgi:hypothetical protein
MIARAAWLTEALPRVFSSCSELEGAFVQLSAEAMEGKPAHTADEQMDVS